LEQNREGRNYSGNKTEKTEMFRQMVRKGEGSADRDALVWDSQHSRSRGRKGRTGKRTTAEEYLK
jgi:hypothetical protein